MELDKLSYTHANIRTRNMPIKIVIMGDVSVGKTSLCMSYIANKFTKKIVPAIFARYSQTVNIDGNIYTLRLWDTAVGYNDGEKLRPFSYRNTWIFLVCFSVVSHTSFENVKETWVPEIRKNCEKTQFLLVGRAV